MTLGTLVAAARTLAPDARSRVQQSGHFNAPVRGIAHDSRAVAAGSVFVAIKGQRADGAAFAADALRRGAVAIVSEAAAPAGVLSANMPRAPRTEPEPADRMSARLRFYIEEEETITQCPNCRVLVEPGTTVCANCGFRIAPE